MNITVFGTGYVGLVTGTCLAAAGYRVLCVDIDTARIEALNNGIVPFFEPGLEELVRDNLLSGRLRFTTCGIEGVQFGTYIFIAVGTPSTQYGNADLNAVMQVAHTIGANAVGYKMVIMKSTVPVGTTQRVEAVLHQALDFVRGGQNDDATRFDVVSNPEFLREGSAVRDFMRPDRIVIGVSQPAAAAPLQEMYAPFNRNHDRLMIMDVRSAELVKYAANALLATKVSFMNEIALLADKLGADIENVRVGVGSDPRIGYSFIYAGCGYGGACLPKDVRALNRQATELGCDAPLLRAVELVNRRQQRRLFELVAAHFGGTAALAGKTLALWGLAFKAGTDDIREAPSCYLMEALWRSGARVRAYDPEAMDACHQKYGRRDDLELSGNKESTLHGADGLVVCTEWKGFMTLDPDLLLARLREPVVFDGRNLYDPQRLARAGIMHYGIGRGTPQRRLPDSARSGSNYYSEHHSSANV